MDGRPPDFRKRVKPRDNSEFAIRYVDATTSNIRARYVQNRMINKDWVFAIPDDIRYSGTEDTAIAGYGNQCHESCQEANFMVFRNENDGQTHVGYPYTEEWGFSTFPSEAIGADNGTAYAIVPILQLSTDEYPYVAMYLSAESKLKEMYFAQEREQKWKLSNMNVNLTIDAGSQIAAMSYLLDDLRYVQVLVTHEDGGVMMAYLDGGPDKHWAETTSVSGMEDVIPLSPIAANQAGRVYALENVNGTPEIVEWKRNSTTGTPSFERLGPVTPTPTT
ncbi:putative fungal fucose-specific lectin protein [Neofusicoccum parvum UCRNP2]|uniref:Putative fungal fucose-specific lectin protein n=1 Tax=Botryosphaeria parva (strain UCR-NP2) TaxID=1287680 RepID=R1GD83_BOTPV|nr:putative fungal fucose-specific lectin protein [Neofusicoccum parvum UCRNP2]